MNNPELLKVAMYVVLVVISLLGLFFILLALTVDIIEDILKEIW